MLTTPDYLLEPPASLAYILNAEFTLHSLQKGTLLRYNPFLSHWVESVTLLQQQVDAAPADPARHEQKLHIRTVHLELVKAILTERQDILQACGDTRPDDLVHELSPSTRLDLQPFIRILEEEGIYEGTTLPLEDHIQPQTSQSSAALFAPEQANAREHAALTPDSVARQLKLHPYEARAELARLPVDLPTLELYNKLLASDAFVANDIDPVAIVRQYVQHGLRTIEHMAQPQPAMSSSSGQDEDTDEPAGGKEEQVRSVKLLVLFLSNLIRKGQVSPEEVYFEIQELCVRYVWIREVREFRSFMEQGAFAA